jgi:HrpA-like RNA helicase
MITNESRSVPVTCVAVIAEGLRDVVHRTLLAETAINAQAPATCVLRLVSSSGTYGADAATSRLWHHAGFDAVSIDEGGTAFAALVATTVTSLVNASARERIVVIVLPRSLETVQHIARIAGYEEDDINDSDDGDWLHDAVPTPAPAQLSHTLLTERVLPEIICIYDATMTLPPYYAVGRAPIKFSVQRVTKAEKNGGTETWHRFPGYRSQVPLRQQLADLSLLADVINAAPSRCSVVEGPTGTGKSTLVPLALIDADPAVKVWCTQPRRVAALNLTQRIRDLRGSQSDAVTAMGGAYLHPLDEHLASVVFMTPGILLKRIIAAANDGTYLHGAVTHIVIDEVHEQALETDLTMCLMRVILARNASVRLVVMSATASRESLRCYVRQLASPLPAADVAASARLEPDGDVWNLWTAMWEEQRAATAAEDIAESVPLLQLRRDTSAAPSEDETRTVLYLEHICDLLEAPSTPSDVKFGIPASQEILASPLHRDRQRSSAGHARRGRLTDARFTALLALTKTLHLTRPAAEGILVFVSGVPMAERVIEALVASTVMQKAPLPCRVVAFHGGSDLDSSYDHLFASTDDANTRLLVIATNAAESSVTIPSVDHVVDTCLHKISVFRPQDRVHSLEEDWCGRANCVQRAGRTGRVRRGTVWRLVTRREFDVVLPHAAPAAFANASIASAVLQAAQANSGSVFDVLLALPTPPEAPQVHHAFDELEHIYRAIRTPRASNGTKAVGVRPGVAHLTTIGCLLGQLPVDPACGLLVIIGAMLGVGWLAAAAVAVLSSRTVVLCPDVATLNHEGTYCCVLAQVLVLLDVESEAPVALSRKLNAHAVKEATFKLADLTVRVRKWGLTCARPASPVAARDVALLIVSMCAAFAPDAMRVDSAACIGTNHDAMPIGSSNECTVRVTVSKRPSRADLEAVDRWTEQRMPGTRVEIAIDEAESASHTTQLIVAVCGPVDERVLGGSVPVAVYHLLHAPTNLVPGMSVLDARLEGCDREFSPMLRAPASPVELDRMCLCAPLPQTVRCVLPTGLSWRRQRVRIVSALPLPGALGALPSLLAGAFLGDACDVTEREPSAALRDVFDRFCAAAVETHPPSARRSADAGGDVTAGSGTDRRRATDTTRASERRTDLVYGWTMGCRGLQRGRR